MQLLGLLNNELCTKWQSNHLAISFQQVQENKLGTLKTLLCDAVLVFAHLLVKL